MVKPKQVKKAKKVYEKAKCHECGMPTIDLVPGRDYAPDELRCERDYALAEIRIAEEVGDITKRQANRKRKLIEDRIFSGD